MVEWKMVPLLRGPAFWRKTGNYLTMSGLSFRFSLAGEEFFPSWNVIPSEAMNPLQARRGFLVVPIVGTSWNDRPDKMLDSLFRAELPRALARGSKEYHKIMGIYPRQ